MNKCAVLHIPLSQYAYALDEHRLVLRIRTAKNDIKKCYVNYGDRVDEHQPIEIHSIVMEKTASDDLFDYYEALIESSYTRVCYYFKLTGEGDTLYYYQRGFSEEITDNRTEYFQFPYIRREDILRIPRWMEETVLYQIFPDSFANKTCEIKEEKKRLTVSSEIESENRLGGTIQGIYDNIPYLHELGINCIYLNPVFTANSYHKYDTIDYFTVDPCFGSNEDLKKLVKECHKQGIRVLLDGVFNHCGKDFFAFRDVMEKGENSPYHDWFYYMPCPVEYKNPPKYEAFAYVKEMPKLNTGNKEVAAYLCRVGRFWVEEADIDGWRLDVANEINHDFWRQFRKEVKRVKPDAVFIGEIWEDAENWLLGGDQFDSAMNYPFTYLCRDFFAKRSMSATEFDAQLQRMFMRYPEQLNRVQMNMLDSHDVPRFLTYCNGDRKRLALAFLFMFTMIGMPSVFYGDECFLMGEKEYDYRAPMNWKDRNNELFNLLQRLIHIRKEHPAFIRGSYQPVLLEDEKNIFAYSRRSKEQEYLIVLNNGEEEYILQNNLLCGKEYVDLLTGQSVTEGYMLEKEKGIILQEKKK